MLTGMLRLQNEHRSIGDDEQYAETRLVNYSLRCQPLETASLSLSFTDSWGFVRNQEIQENVALVSQFHGNPLPALAMSVEGGFSRNQQLLSDRIYDSWSFQASFDGDILPKMGAVVTYGYRYSQEEHTLEASEQNRVGGSLTLQATRTIFLRAEADGEYAGSWYVSQTYSGNWSPLPRLNLGAQTSLISEGGGSPEERSGYYADYQLAGRSNAYLRYSRNRSRGPSSEPPAETTQLGFRTGF